MAINTVNIGNIPNDGTGDDLRTAFDKINGNFAALGLAQGSGPSSAAAANTTVLRDSSGNIYSNKSYFKNIFNKLADLPPAGNWPGMFVYVDGVGAYFSNGNSWKKLPNYNSATPVNDGVLRWTGSEFAASDPGVKTINSLSGNVVLTSNDIFTIMGFVPLGANNGEFPGDIIRFTGTGALKLPSGLTAQRPGVVSGTTAVPGMMRYNNQLDCVEAFIGPAGSVAWQTIGPLGSAPATFTSATIATLSATTVSATNITASAGINGALGTVTPAAATVTALASSGAVTISSNTPTVSAGTGALVVTGGVSIGDNLYVGGGITMSSNSEATSTTSAAFVVLGGIGIGKKLYVGGITTLNSTDESNSTGTGALVVAGGAGIAKNAYVGGILNVAGAATLGGTLTVTGGVTMSDLAASSIIFTDSTKKLTTTGAITVSQGGTGINSYTLGDTIYANGTTSLAILAGNVTTTKKFLTQTGTGSVSAAPAWGTIADIDLSTALFKDYTTGVAGPTPATTTSNTIHGFNAYSSTDFPGSYYTGWTVKGSTVGAQLAVGWNVDNGTAAVFDGSISGNRLTVNTVTTGAIAVGQLLFGANILAHSYVRAFISGSPGAVGIYLISRTYPVAVTSQTIKTYAGRIKPDVWVRSNDDTGDTAAWSEWDRVITSYSSDYELAIANIFATGFIQPSNGNTAANGIIFPSDPGGGSGDTAKIQYYAVSGEQSELVLSVTNDSEDNIRLSASGMVYVDNTLDTTQHRSTFNNYSSAIALNSTVVFDCAATGDIIYISGLVSGAWTANLVNLRLDVGKSKTITFVLTQDANPYLPSLQISTVATSIFWANASVPTGTAYRKELVNLRILCTAANTYVVLGQLTSFG
jgi:hypothetical protein